MKTGLLLISILCVLSHSVSSQIKSASEQPLSYDTWLQQAIDAAENADNDGSYQKALAMFEDLFRAYPDRIDTRGYYETAVLASKLNQVDKAFHYLTLILDTNSQYGPGWVFIIGKYRDDSFDSLTSDSRWDALVSKARQNKELFYHSLEEQQKEFFAHKQDSAPFSEKGGQNGVDLYTAIKSRHDYLPKKQREYSITFSIDDTTKTSYYIRLPRQYNPSEAYPLLMVLHGAVKYNQLEDFQTSFVLENFNRFYTGYADKYDVILVFPGADKKYNWMKPDDGFFMVPEIVKQIRQTIHIDENRVFVTGHSNGATGSFSYWMKQPSPFAGFFGFNTQPKIQTGGTFIMNGKSRFFVNFSTDQDYYFPPQANDSLNVLTRQLGLDYQDHRYNGYPHWFPEFDASEAAFQIIFKQIKERKRNPFPQNIYWETDDVKYGRADWLEIIQLDTLHQRSSWHKTCNFDIHTWLKYNDEDELISEDVNKSAFDFPHASGAIKAQYTDNTFNVQTSCIKAFRIYISPEMVDLKKKISVYVNGKLRFSEKIQEDNTFLMHSFSQNFDREQIWVNYIDIK